MAKKAAAKKTAPAAPTPAPAAPAPKAEVTPIHRLRARVQAEIDTQQSVVPTSEDEKQRRYGRIAALEDVLGWLVEDPNANVYDGAIPPGRVGAWVGEPVTRPKRRALAGRSSAPAAAPKRVKRQR
jgi:hypothetical protein